MKAIATYSEVTLTGKRKYELYSDSIVIKGSGTWSYEFEQTLVLKKISPDYVRLRIRPSVAWISLTMFLLTGLACILLIYEFPIRSDAIPGVLGIFSGSALIVALATMRKVEHARFCSENYASVLLSVARSGPERNQFDTFVQTLVSQIEHAKKLDQESPQTRNEVFSKTSL
jgi:hypothetical protein